MRICSGGRCCDKISDELLSATLGMFFIKVTYMNRYLILIVLCSISLNCANKKISEGMKRAGNSSDTETLFTISKLDSINNYYLIYARRSDTLYKIVSAKLMSDLSEKIQIDSSYPLILTSIWRKKERLGSLELTPSNSLHVNCLAFDDSTVICLERDSINDLFHAENLRGLHLIRE